MREAWDNSKRFGPLSEQQVVLTVPASFDEEARELTVQAAHDAGLEQLTLIEEPAAAFYSLGLPTTSTRSRKLLFDGQVVLICDVGGGTSDFSLIRVARDGDKIDFTRTAVGKHLLLGGDNLDLTLAWLAETKIGKSLSIRQRSGLRRECSAAKEILLNDPNRQSVEISVLGSGSSMIGGTLKTEITRAEALELALDGFLPITLRGEMPKEEKAQPTPRTRPALRFRPRYQSPSGRVSGIGWSSPRRHTLQRRLLHPRNSAGARSRRAGQLAATRQTSGDFRKPRSSISLLPAAQLTTHMFGPQAPACSCVVACRAPTTLVSTMLPPSASSRAARKKATRSRSIAKVCNWWPISRSHSGSSARSRVQA